jgi:Domain of unknown function (DUF5666)/Putative binding domain, N-terminal/Viral BACON domain
VTIAINRECEWTAKPEVDWISLTSEAKGQGDASVNYTIAANPIVGERRGGIAVNDQRLEITQAAAPCTFALNATSQAVDAAGGKPSVTVTAQAPCRWTATSQTGWIAIASGGSGAGNGTVTLAVSANGAEPRSGTVVIAGQTFTITQPGMPAQPTPAPPPPSPTPTPPTPAPPPPPTPSPPPACSFTLSDSSQDIGASGGTGSVAVSARSDCAWTATSQSQWLVVHSGASGSGNGVVQFSAAPTTATSPRSGTLMVAGQTFTVRQAGAPQPCTFSLTVTTQSVPATGGQRQIGVTASTSTCAWTAVTSTPWITITAGAAGTGNGQTTYTASANTALSSRTGTVTVAGQSVTVSQAAFVPEPINLDGRVSGLQGSCPSLTFTLEGRTIRTNGQTDFRKGNCDKLENGDKVKFEGLSQADGSVLATKVEL